MRKAQKQKIEVLIDQMEEAHRQIKKYIEQKNTQSAMLLLEDCQTSGITIGTLIENTEGEKHPIVLLLEDYCELIYQIHENLSVASAKELNENKIYKLLRQKLVKVSNYLKNNIRVKIEAVFLPYKVSMWDSMESVWRAAQDDENCDTYVIPIPYYDKNPDGSFNKMYYEGKQYPAYVPITNYEEFDFGQHKPDMIYIHSPYDYINLVTSVHPFFYSDNLKKYTECLVYIPYYATTGGMSKGQASCPAYYNADYIVIQSEKHRKFFDKQIPDNKFLAFGSPKFDSVIRTCQNPPEVPKEWNLSAAQLEKIKNVKVYFYNTSIAAMLDNTENFLRKMEYVFHTFKGRKDAYLLWRPHPLIESTFDSMRREYKSRYEVLKRQFIDEQIGIYDATPNIENAIALSDVYIGDGGSSVVSLFGVVGKPIFILDKNLNEKSGKDDWKGTIFVIPRGDRQNRYCILPGNRLYYSPDNDFRYEYYCDLSEYAIGGYYSGVIEYENKAYVVPASAQHFLVVDTNKKIRRIALKNKVEQPGAFLGFWFWKDKIYLLPDQYPALVILDLQTESLTYISGIRDFNIGLVNDERISAAKWIWRDKLYFLNPTGDKVLIIDMTSYESMIKEVSFGRLLTGCASKEIDYEILWLIPWSDTIVTQWNLETDEVKNYDIRLEGMTAVHRRYKTECEINVLGSIGFYDENIIISPNWGNKFVELNTNTGEVREWYPPFEIRMQDKNKYYPNWGMGFFTRDMFDGSYRYFYAPERKIYDIDLKTKKVKEVEVLFDKEEVLNHAPGFSKWSEWTQYICVEDVFNSLEDLLNNNIHGNQFDKEKQIQLYATVNASVDGDCGKKVYRFLSEKLND